MENRYWIARKRGAMTMAHRAVSAEARLIHYDLAGRYSVMAAQCAAIAASAASRATGEPRPVLHLRTPGAPPYGTLDRLDDFAPRTSDAGGNGGYGERS